MMNGSGPYGAWRRASPGVGDVFLGGWTAAPFVDRGRPETDAAAVRFDEVAIAHADETGLSGGRVEEEGDVGGRGRGGSMVDGERL